MKIAPISTKMIHREALRLLRQRVDYYVTRPGVRSLPVEEIGVQICYNEYALFATLNEFSQRYLVPAMMVLGARCCKSYPYGLYFAELQRDRKPGYDSYVESYEGVSLHTLAEKPRMWFPYERLRGPDISFLVRVGRGSSL